MNQSQRLQKNMVLPQTVLFTDANQIPKDLQTGQEKTLMNKFTKYMSEVINYER